MNDRGFVEPRIMMGGAGLEQVMWQTLVLGGQLTEPQYMDTAAHDLLRKVLTAAQIPIDVDFLSTSTETSCR